MSMVLPTMFRDTQNTDTPNLPFAQSLSPTMYRDTQNPDTPNLPFAQGFSTQEKQYVLMSLGRINQDVGSLYRIHKEQEGRITSGYQHRLGIERKITEIENRPTGSGFTKPQIETILTDYYGDDIKRLDRIHKEQEGRITSGYEHRKSIESKVEKNISAFPDIHTKLSDLGTSVSDVSSAFGTHKAEFDIHKQHDLIPNPFGDILPYVLIGGVALLAMRKK